MYCSVVRSSCINYTVDVAASLLSCVCSFIYLKYMDIQGRHRGTVLATALNTARKYLTIYIYNIHPNPEYRFLISLVNAFSIARVTTCVSDGASDTVVLDGEGVSRPLRYGVEIGVASSGLGSTDEERRLRFSRCEL